MSKDDKEFFEKNKNWIFMILLTIFVIDIEYINMFENTILNGIVNIAFGIIVIILTSLFYNEEKNWINSNSRFYKFLVYILLIIGIINSFYHVGYAIGKIIALV
ncbi:MAG: hypothetical protein ACI33S_00555 [Bacilli bacterium]